MQIAFCILIFIMGTVFGSFFTLAVYRIPLNKNIVNERSFCPKCNHRLEAWDLIPVLSYIFLRGRCRYCKEKVRIRYLLLEVLSGIVFLTFYLSLNIEYPFFKLNDIVYLAAFVMFYITVVIISGIDKEKFYIDKRVLLFGLLTQAMYQYYLYKFDKISEQYLVLLIGIFLVLFIDTILIKKKAESFYILQNVLFILFLLNFIPIRFWILFFIITFAIWIIYFVYIKVKINLVDKSDILQELPTKQVPLGFCLGISSILIVIFSNFVLI